MNIFMVVIMLPVVPILYFVTRSEAKPKGNLVLGVTLPYVECTSPVVLEICARYKRALALTAILELLIAVPCFFIRSFSIIYTYLMTWLAVVIIATPAVFAVYRRKLMRYKLASLTLIAQDGRSVYVNDDDIYWLGGLVYFNPNDSRTLINNRSGMNMSVNLARPVGKVLTAFAALCIIAMPFTGIFIVRIENTPPVLRLEDGVLTAIHTKALCELPVGEIDSAELVYELPSIKRINGTGMDTVLTGRFRIEGEGEGTVCIDPTSAPFLMIRSDGSCYIVADRNPVITEQVYTQLVRLLL